MKNLFIYIILLLTISCDIAKEIIDSTPDAIDTWDELGDQDWGDLCWCGHFWWWGHRGDFCWWCGFRFFRL